MIDVPTHPFYTWNSKKHNQFNQWMGMVSSNHFINHITKWDVEGTSIKIQTLEIHRKTPESRGGDQPKSRAQKKVRSTQNSLDVFCSLKNLGAFFNRNLIKHKF